MLDNQLFIIKPNLIDYGFNNQFYQITDKRIGIRANSQVFIGGKSVTVVKVMVCKNTWLQQFYYEPLSLYSQNNRGCCSKKACFCISYSLFLIILIFLFYHLYEAYIA